MYYNTNQETGSNLKSSRSKTETQEKVVYELFTMNRNSYITPYEVSEALSAMRMLGANAPITSIRRAMTNLTIEGKLTKTSRRKMGPYGKKCFCWKLA